MKWVRRHAPLVVVSSMAVATYVLALVTSSAFLSSLSASLAGLVVLLVTFDLTPRDAQEKKEKA